MSKVVLAAFVFLVLSYAPIVFGDIYTINCLLGYENDRHDKLCAVIAPETKEAVIEAQRKWKERNRVALIELKSACESRLRRAYGSNEGQLKLDREKAMTLRQQQDEALFADPNRHNLINCRAYAKDFAVGGDKVDIQPWLIEETRNTPAHPVEWPLQK